MTDFLNTAVSGLLAFQRALATSSHNVSNANTPGFSRQRVELASRNPQEFSNGFVGKGTVVRDITRVTNQFVIAQIQTISSDNARLSTFSSLTRQVDNLLADDLGGLSGVLQNFFSSVQGVSNDPASISARQVMLGEAQNIAGRFNFLQTQLDEQNQNVNEQTVELVNQINSISQNIGELNGRIISASNSGGVAEPNDLLDQRDQLINELSGLIGVTTIEADNGALNVFIGSGQMLVFDTNARTLSTIQNPANFSELNIAYQTITGTLDITPQLSGGQLGGLLDFRREILTPTLNELGRLAMVLADTFNTQHREGMDLDNNLGGDFFSLPPIGVITNQDNTGAATVTAAVSDVTALTSSDYRLTYDGANFTLTRLSDNTSVTGASPLSMDGFDVTIAGAAAAGDSFLVRPTNTAARDVSVLVDNVNRIAAANPVRTETSVNNLGSAEISFTQILDITDTDLLDTVEIVFNNPPTDFDIVNITDATTIAAGVPYTSGANIDFNGLRVSVTGNPAAGDRFSVEHNIDGVSDNRNALLLSGLQTQGLVGGSASYQEAYATTIGRVGTLARQADINGDAQSRLLERALQRRDEISGVNLDEEAANLLRFQQAYEAAAQVIAVSDTLFQTLLNSVRR